MKKRILVLSTLMFVLHASAAQTDHSSWDGLLKRYVNGESRVDYGSWKAAGTTELDHYLSQLASRWPDTLTADAKKAALINAYNALAIRWILSHYPVESIWRTDKPFTASRHPIDGQKVSLDAIETRLREMGDPRVHSVLVCAARSCPPLRREAYVPERLDGQLDENTRAWLANRTLNEFHPDKRFAEVSSIFKWYRQDFDSAGGLQSFLERHAPPQFAAFLRGEGVRIKFKDYHWGLNDTSTLGERYSGLKFWWDWLRNRN